MSNIVIDPGHGGTKVINGSKIGATGPNGILEKNMTLDIAVMVAERLNQNRHNVFLTRNEDVNIGLKDRALIAQNKSADVFVSIHFNSDADSSVQGTEVLLHPLVDSDSKLLASSLLQRLVTITKYKNRGLKLQKLGVLNPSHHRITTAKCLIEISFISNAAEAERLKDKTYRNSLADSIVIAIEDYIKRSTSIEIVEPQNPPLAGEDVDG